MRGSFRCGRGPGLAIHLSGDLGAGKSAFARAFIRGLALDDREFDIPSPSFSLVQSYDALRVPVVHVDLYRISSPAEVAELGLEEFLAKSLMIIEWPEKLPENISPDHLKISFTGSGDTRDLKLEAAGKWIEILKRDEIIKGFVNQSQVAGGTRSHFEGDASARRYERVAGNAATLLLMDMPSRPDGPVVKNGKPYSAIAHLAEGISAVVGINDYLFKLDYSVPRIYAADVKLGLALIESAWRQGFQPDDGAGRGHGRAHEGGGGSSRRHGRKGVAQQSSGAGRHGASHCTL